MRLKRKEDERDQSCVFNRSVVRLQLEGIKRRVGLDLQRCYLAYLLCYCHPIFDPNIKALRFRSSLCYRVLFKQTIPEASKQRRDHHLFVLVKL